MLVSIKILTDSVRPGRFNNQVADWVHTQAKEAGTGAEIELVDLAKINLPFLDEAIPPSAGKYRNEHTVEWAKAIGEADGFIFVTPEYNHSYSPVLKNAIDYLFAEWHFKLVSFVSYGSAAGGARVVEHLRGLLAK